MDKIKVGILTMSDGRQYLHKSFYEINMEYQHKIAEALKKTGKFDIIEGAQPINTNDCAREEAKRLAREGAEVTIFNYAIWCYPQFTAVAQNFAPGPYLLFSNLHPSQCGMVGMLAAAGTMDQLGKNYKKIWGDIGEPDILKKVCSFLLAAAAVKRLRGLTFGNFGGRPLGMYTAIANTEQWQRDFGIDVENIEQEDIVRAGEAVSEAVVDRALVFLEKHVKAICYDGNKLTPDKLKMQIRAYYGLKKIIAERKLDFIGIKAHGDLTDHYVTMDIAEAFLNDPYDFDGPKEPIVAATESDMDGALTMQLFKHITGGQPVLFADVRHYDPQEDVWYFSNSGTHATFFAGKSLDPAVNLKNVTLYPETDDYPAGGASVHHFAKEGQVTLARLSRKNGKYQMTIVPAHIVEFSQQKMEQLGAVTTPQWPIAFTKLEVSADVFLQNFPCNHIHGVYGDFVEELIEIAEILGMQYTILREKE